MGSQSYIQNQIRICSYIRGLMMAPCSWNLLPWWYVCILTIIKLCVRLNYSRIYSDYRRLMERWLIMKCKGFERKPFFLTRCYNPGIRLNDKDKHEELQSIKTITQPRFEPDASREHVCTSRRFISIYCHHAK